MTLSESALVKHVAGREARRHQVNELEEEEEEAREARGETDGEAVAVAVGIAGRQATKEAVKEAAKGTTNEAVQEAAEGTTKEAVQEAAEGTTKEASDEAGDERLALNLAHLAERTRGLSGAETVALVRDAALRAIEQRQADGRGARESSLPIRVTMAHLEAAAATAVAGRRITPEMLAFYAKFTSKKGKIS